MKFARAFVPAVAAAVLSSAFACGGQPSEVDPNAVVEDDIIASFGKVAGIDLAKPTRVILVGDSDKLSTLPLHAATSRARRYAQLYPDQQIVLFITKDASAADVKSTGAAVVQSEPFGEGVRIADFSRLSTSKVLGALDQFRRIASIDFFGHSSPFGALLEAEGPDRILNSTLPANAAGLRDNFARDLSPYVTLNGCNGGVEVAGKLSALWALPVSGALTASNFQELKSDNHFYVNEPTDIPDGIVNAKTNTVSYPGEAPSCAATGACTRMKPQDAPYFGVWSNQDHGMQYGLNYYKFFCDYADADKSCVKGMASSLYAFVGEKALSAASSEADLKAVLADFFCTQAKDPAWFSTCKAGLENAVATGAAFSPMRVRNDFSLECDFKKCEQEFRCDKVNGIAQKKTCNWVAAGCPEGAAADSAKCFVKNTKKQTTAREYAAYLEGHKLLSAAPVAAVTCLSSTLARTVPVKTCVQSKKDGKWYRCEQAGWTAGDGVAECVARFPL
jgi:hypothetical protein